MMMTITPTEPATTHVTSPTTGALFEVIIGLEVHVQLNTQSKLFSTAPNRFGSQPNANTTGVCMALPGVLPVLNGQALEHAVRLGLALGSHINPYIKFDRKQYFYPDLPKGYQISQFDYPVCEGGTMTLPNGRVVRITRAHLEEDAGKLVHVGAEGLAGSTHSLVDLNRAGAPLVEVVSEPDIRSAQEASAYVEQLRNTVRYLGICDGNLDEGSLRCDANVSIRPVGSTTLGNRTETKNMNSFRSIERAIESEVLRQIGVVEAGGTVTQESRLWDEATGTTRPMRSKEDAHDYRYFPCPDLPPVHIAPSWIEALKSSQPELPTQRLERLQQAFSLSPYDAGVLVEFKELGDLFLTAAAHTSAFKPLVNYLMGDIASYLKTEKTTLQATALTPAALAELATLTEAKEVSSAIAKQLLPVLLQEGGTPSQHMAAMGLSQVSDEGELKTLIAGILAANEGQVAAYRGGKDKLFGFFVGQAMKATQGRANPEVLNTLLKEALGPSGE
jgi:aspartyl-tRNA(Asn)/glutamyl-tRNA(Gln) amidotransferase subunit B